MQCPSAFVIPSSSSVFTSITLLLLLLQCHSPVPFVNGQRSFAETIFDLPADFPAEDPPPAPIISANQDASVSTEIAPVVTVPSSSSLPMSTTTSQPAIPSTIPTASISTSSTSVITSSSVSNTTNMPKTPLPSLPELVELPSIVKSGNAITVPPSLIEHNAAVNYANQTAETIVEHENFTSQTTAPYSAPSMPPKAKVPPSTIGGRQQQQKDNNQTIGVGKQQQQKQWFKDSYDTEDCPSDAETMATMFRRKFPRNLLRHQKETILAELLANRLRECFRKQKDNHWATVYRSIQAVENQNENSGEQERMQCMAGLVQEQIACLNVHSYSCQFIQTNYVFRLVPTRIIVQEAKLAEEGAEKCARFVKNQKL